MKKGFVAVVVLLVAVVAAAVWFVRRDSRAVYYTGFVEGEERVIRSEVVGRVLEVAFAEGAAVPPNSVVARLDEGDIAAKITAKQRELDMTKADIETQSRRIGLVESTWKTGVDARRAEVAQAESALTLAERTFSREAELAKTGASTGQLVDEARSRRDQARAALARAKDLLSQAAAEEKNVSVNQGQLEMLRQRAALTEAQIAELEVTRAKYQIRSPGVPTVVQTQFVWPGELAQPGSPVVAVLDPEDKYVQVYLPVASMGHVRVGSRVELELDSTPGRRIPGEISFIADQANFTPEKIETRGDRVGQVYRAKIRVLQDAALLKPGTEGNVYLLADAGSHGGDEPRAASR